MHKSQDASNLELSWSESPFVLSLHTSLAGCMSLRGLRVVVAVDPDVSLAEGSPRFKSVKSIYDADVIGTLLSLGAVVEVLRVRVGDCRIIDRLLSKKPDLVFNLALSTDRSEACWPAALEMCGVPFTGSGTTGILLTADKSVSRSVLRSRGIRVPRSQTFCRGEPVRSLVLRLPVLVKPSTLGGSLGIHLKSLGATVAEVRHLVKAVHRQFEVPALCDEFIEGREFTVPFVERPGRGPELLRPREWFFPKLPGAPRFKTERLKADTKYGRRWGFSGAEAQLSRRHLVSLRESCLEAFRVLSVRGYGTIDCRLDSSGRLFVIDVNANPGISPRNSIWHVLPFTTIIERIVRSALLPN